MPAAIKAHGPLWTHSCCCPQSVVSHAHQSTPARWRCTAPPEDTTPVHGLVHAHSFVARCPFCVQENEGGAQLLLPVPLPVPLQDCDLYVLDSCAAVTIDDSKNCRIFIGPTDGRWVQMGGPDEEGPSVEPPDRLPSYEK
eukprot:scaffold24395_cov21-Tisochrysis_lutea.AAC.1